MEDCRAFARAVSDYLDGAVELECRAAMEDHLGRCQRCRLLCQTMRRTVELYRALPSARIPADVESRLIAALERRIGCK